ncbi:MAG: hypothetical protein V4663_11800 [Bacteroidota bacterium]
MKQDQKTPETRINAPVSSNQPPDEPKSAHSTPVVEKYVKKRKEKAERQADEEHKTDSFWGAIKYVIL